MRAVATVVLASLALGGCQTTLDPNYALQLESYRLTITSQQNVEMAKSRAEEARYNAIAAVAERADAASKQMAIFALALLRGGDVQVRNVEVQLPRIPETQEDRALKWASILVPTVATVAIAGFSASVARTQSNNQAATTQASYTAFTKFAAPIDFTKIPPTTVTNTWTSTNIRDDNNVTNHDGFVQVGGQAPVSGTQDNRVTTPAPVITPVVVVPPVVPIVPVVTGP